MLLPAPFDIFIERGIAYGPLIITVYDDLPPIGTPSEPIISVIGTTGVATWTYKIEALKPSTSQFSSASAGGSTMIGNATLDSTNYNIVAWDAVDDAELYRVYRTAVGGTPNSTGLIGTTTGLVFNDTGIAGDSSSPPTVGGPGVVVNLTGYNVYSQARRIPDDTVIQDLAPTIILPATNGQIQIGKFTDEQTLNFKPVTNGKWSLVVEDTNGDRLPAIVAGAYSVTASVTRNEP